MSRADPSLTLLLMAEHTPENLRKWMREYVWRNRRATLLRIENERKIAAKIKALKVMAEITKYERQSNCPVGV